MKSVYGMCRIRGSSTIGLVMVLAMLARVISRCFFASTARSIGPTMPSRMSAIIIVRDAATCTGSRCNHSRFASG